LIVIVIEVYVTEIVNGLFSITKIKTAFGYNLASTKSGNRLWFDL